MANRKVNEPPQFFKLKLPIDSWAVMNRATGKYFAVCPTEDNADMCADALNALYDIHDTRLVSPKSHERRKWCNKTKAEILAFTPICNTGRKHEYEECDA